MWFLETPHQRYCLIRSPEEGYCSTMRILMNGSNEKCFIKGWLQPMNAATSEALTMECSCFHCRFCLLVIHEFTSAGRKHIRTISNRHSSAQNYYFGRHYHLLRQLQQIICPPAVYQQYSTTGPSLHYIDRIGIQSDTLLSCLSPHSAYPHES